MTHLGFEFGTVLRAERLAADLTQERLAEQAGLSVDAIRRLENGTRRAPRRETVTRLASALHLGEGPSRHFFAAAQKARIRGPSVVETIEESETICKSAGSTVKRSLVPLLALSAGAALLLLVGALILGKALAGNSRHLPALAEPLKRRPAAHALEAPASPVCWQCDPQSQYGQALRVTAASQCTSDWSERVSNNTHGTVALASGTGAFASLGPQNKELTVPPGAELNGSVFLIAQNGGAPFAIAPFIYTPTWGTPQSSWRLIARWVPDGAKLYSPNISLSAPHTTGIYHIIFAFQLEKTGADVASATNWPVRQPLWNGDRLAAFSDEQIREAQRFGCTIAIWRFANGYASLLIPADAITVQVQ